jgi:putative exporter of polyketide antibiotics
MSAITALVLVQARRDRIVLPVWILGIAFLGYAVTSAVATEIADEAERTSIIMVAAASPAFRFVRGLPDGSGYRGGGVLSGLCLHRSARRADGHVSGYPAYPHR